MHPASDGSMTPSRFLNSFEGNDDWIDSICNVSPYMPSAMNMNFNKPQPSVSSQQQQMMTAALHRREKNPFEMSFESPMQTSANTVGSAMHMPRDLSPNSQRAFQSMIDNYHYEVHAQNPLKRPLSPGQLLQSPQQKTDSKRPKHDVLQHGTLNPSWHLCSHTSSNPSSLESIVSSQPDSGEEDNQRKSRSTRSSMTSEEPIQGVPMQQQKSLDLNHANAMLREQQMTGASLPYRGMPLNSENMSQLNVRNFAQNNGSFYTQALPKAIPPGTFSRPQSIPHLHAPHPVRPDPATAHLQQINDVTLNNVKQEEQMRFDHQQVPPIVTPKVSTTLPSKSKKQVHKRKNSARDAGQIDQLFAEGTTDDQPILAANGEDIKRAQFLERNRLAACRSRRKKKEWIKSLEHSAEDMAQRNNDLESANASMAKELSDIRAIVNERQRCNCGAMQSLHSALCAKGLLDGPDLPDLSPTTTAADLPTLTVEAPRLSKSVSASSISRNNNKLVLTMPSYDDSTFDMLNSGTITLPTAMLDTPNLARESEFANTIV